MNDIFNKLTRCEDTLDARENLTLMKKRVDRLNGMKFRMQQLRLMENGDLSMS